jgi:hypothetical protein
MESARYLRDQALLCLDLARLMSDPQAAEAFRASAVAYFARAIEVEQGQTATSQSAHRNQVMNGQRTDDGR